MKRGDIWTAAGGAGYAGKPRIGRLADEDMVKLGRALVVFMGLA